MTNIKYQQRTFRERIAQSNVEELQAQLAQLRRHMAALLDSEAERRAYVPPPPTGVVRCLGDAEHMGCLDDEGKAWLALVAK